MFVVAPNVCGSFVFGFEIIVLCVLSSFVIILLRERELFALIEL